MPLVTVIRQPKSVKCSLHFEVAIRPCELGNISYPSIYFLINVNGFVSTRLFDLLAILVHSRVTLQGALLLRAKYHTSGLYAFFFKWQGYQGIFSLVKGTLWVYYTFLQEHFKGTKALTRGYGGNRLRCLCVVIIIILKSYIVHVSTKQGTQALSIYKLSER